MSSCQKHRQFDSPNTTQSVKCTNALYITVFLPSRNVWSGYNTETVPKQVSSLFSSLIVPVKQIQIMKLQMPVLNPNGSWVYPFEYGGPNSCFKNWPYICADRDRTETAAVFAPVHFHFGTCVRAERERVQKRERGFVASSNGKCYCHIHILKAIVVSMFPKA